MDDIKQEKAEAPVDFGTRVLAQLAHEKARAAVYRVALERIADPTRRLTQWEPRQLAALALEAVEHVRAQL